jgi:anti-anti-sigma factor
MAFRYHVDPPLADGILRLSLSGRLTLGPQLVEFGRKAGELVSTQRPAGVLLDIMGIEEMDSAGLGELVILYTLAGQIGARVCLVQPSPRIVHLLETTKLSGILPHFDTAESGASWIQNG